MLHYTLYRACHRHISIGCLEHDMVKRLALIVLRGTLIIVVWINGPHTWVARSSPFLRKYCMRKAFNHHGGFV